MLDQNQMMVLLEIVHVLHMQVTTLKDIAKNSQMKMLN